MTTYVTFGQNHYHEVDGKKIDRDCVAVLPSKTASEGRDLAFRLFGLKFCFEYFEDQWEEEKMRFFPRGYVDLRESQ